MSRPGWNVADDKVPEGSYVLDQIVVTRYVDVKGGGEPMLSVSLSENIGAYDFYAMMGIAMSHVNSEFPPVGTDE